MQDLQQKAQPVAIENPPPLSPVLTPQEQTVLYGSVREKLLTSSTTNGAALGAVGGALMGGAWSLATGGAHWGRKILGTAVASAIVGAVVSRMSWGKDMAEKQTAAMQQQVSQLTPEQQAAAYDQISQSLGIQKRSFADRVSEGREQAPEQAL